MPVTTAAGHEGADARLVWPVLSFDRLVVALMALGLLAMAARVSVDSDTWWHLRAGAWMLAERRILTFDAFSHTFAGQPWDYPAWLSQMTLYFIFDRFSYAGLNLLTAVCVTAAFGLVFAAAPGRLGVRVAAVLLGAIASSVFWSARPQILSLVLSAAFLLVLQRFRRGGRNRLWLLPPLMALWANLHPGFATGFIFLGLTLAGEAIRAVLGRQQWRAVAWLAAISGGCLIALLLTPYGADLILFPFKTVAIGLLREHIQEWQSPNFHWLVAQPFIWLWLAVMAALGLARVRVDITDFLLLSATAYLALLAGRNIALFALVAPPVLARHADALLTEAGARYGPRFVRLARPASRPFRLANLLNWLILLLVAVAATLKLIYISDPALNADLATRGMPVEAAAFLAEQRPAGLLYNPYEWGGYLSWRLYPDYPIFVDGRTDLYSDDFFSDYLQLAGGDENSPALLERYGVELVLTQPDSPLAARIVTARGWTELYADPVAVIYSRTN